MTSVAAPPADRTPRQAALAAVAPAVDGYLDEFLAGEETRWTTVDPELAGPVRTLRDFLAAGGKRLRPAFFHWGFLGAGGHADHPALVETAAALELLHAFALIHDDVMDGSATRRGRPAVHRAIADRHAAGGGLGESRRFGEGAAVLAGDLAFAYASLLVSDLPAGARAVWHELQIELTMGQHLDLVATARGDRSARLAQRIAVFKSGRYTVERPLHLGAAVAGWFRELGPHYSAYGAPLGEAFQWRDDLLGVFGDPAATGKPVGDDLREGKPTLLLALTAARAEGDPAATALLSAVGRAELDDREVACLQELIDGCGAREAVEAAIEQRVARAVDALDRSPVDGVPAEALRELAGIAAWRDR